MKDVDQILTKGVCTSDLMHSKILLACLGGKLSVIEIPIHKELTVNCLIDQLGSWSWFTMPLSVL